MPQLYGHPFKYELRAEIHQLRSDLWKERKEHRTTRLRLRYAQLKIDELHATIQRMQQQARGILAETPDTIEATAKQKLMQSLGCKAA